MNAFETKLRELDRNGLTTADMVRTIQVNVGLKCNLHCAHCHLEANSGRTELMDRATVALILDRVATRPGLTFDLTGGSPELNPNLKWFITKLRELGHSVQVRTNLVVMAEPDHAEMPAFFRDHEVGLVASLPCYLEENVRAQRGLGVYEDSVEVLKRLNGLGYGRDPKLPLSLVYNPGGPFLPPEQQMLESAYQKELAERFGIRFTHLLTITNMPIGRFLEDLRAEGRGDGYETLLRESFNPATVDPLMCRHQITIGWDGALWDCDFNQALGLPVHPDAPRHIRDFTWEKAEGRRIVTGNHCFGCTAGAGSSCGGALLDGDTPEAACAGG